MQGLQHSVRVWHPATLLTCSRPRSSDTGTARADCSTAGWPGPSRWMPAAASMRRIICWEGALVSAWTQRAGLEMVQTPVARRRTCCQTCKPPTAQHGWWCSPPHLHTARSVQRQHVEVHALGGKGRVDAWHHRLGVARLPQCLSQTRAPRQLRTGMVSTNVRQTGVKPATSQPVCMPCCHSPDAATSLMSSHRCTSRLSRLPAAHLLGHCGVRRLCQLHLVEAPLQRAGQHGRQHGAQLHQVDLRNCTGVGGARAGDVSNAVGQQFLRVGQRTRCRLAGSSAASQAVVSCTRAVQLKQRQVMPSPCKCALPHRTAAHSPSKPPNGTHLICQGSLQQPPPPTPAVGGRPPLP